MKSATAVGLGERRHRPGLLAADAQALPARDEHVRAVERRAGAATSAAARGRRCSTLSSTSSVRLPRESRRASRRAVFPAPRRPRALARPRGGRALDRAAAQAAPSDPVREGSEASAAACSASRVLPVPPGPVRVSRRVVLASSRSPTTSASSRSRPRKGVAGTGRFVRYSDLRAGKSCSPSW